MDIDQSLDAMIKAAPKKRGGGKKKNSAAKTTTQKKVGGVKAKVIAKPRRGPKASAMVVDGAWTHDMFRGGGGGGQQGAKLMISNLHPNVTNQDIKELFSQVGKVKKHGLNFDQNGRSKGTAEVIFADRQAATQAIKSYNGVKLDGKPLRIELVGGAPGGGRVLSSGVTVTGGPRKARVVASSGSGGDARKVVAKVVPRPKKAAKGGAAAAAKGTGKGKKRGKKGPKADTPTPMTSEQLDAQLDSYKGAAAMEA